MRLAETPTLPISCIRWKTGLRHSFTSSMIYFVMIVWLPQWKSLLKITYILHWSRNWYHFFKVCTVSFWSQLEMPPAILVWDLWFISQMPSSSPTEYCDPWTALRCVILLVWHMMEYRRYDSVIGHQMLHNGSLTINRRVFHSTTPKLWWIFDMQSHPTVSSYFVPETVQHADKIHY